MMRAELKTLIESVPQATLAAKLRALMPVIDQRIKDGVSYRDIIDALNLHGGLATPLKLQTFRSYLRRYRKKAPGARVQRAAGNFTPAGGLDPSGPSLRAANKTSGRNWT